MIKELILDGDGQATFQLKETGYESRSETRQILHHLAAIDIIAEVGLLDVLKAKV